MSWEDNFPLSKFYDDLYSSKKGAYEEAKHVFIKGNSLTEKFRNLKAEENFSIVEIGFGVGINFLATCEEWLNESKSKKPLQYIAFDKALFSLKQFEKAIGHYPNLKNFSNEYIKEYP